MLSDLIVTIVEGGINPEIDKGIHPPYLYFASKALKLRTGRRRIRDGVCKGTVKYKKEPLFYFEYDEKLETCKIYSIKNGVIADTPFRSNYNIIMID